YVDKKLDGVNCVQPLSRLNRLFPGKQTFILDFVNETEDIPEAFRPYYEQAALPDVTDPQLVYDLKDRLDEERIYHREEIDMLVTAFYDRKATDAQLTYACSFARERYKKRMTSYATESKPKKLFLRMPSKQA